MTSCSQIGEKNVADCISHTMPALIAHEIMHTISRTRKEKIENSTRTRKYAFDSVENLKRVVVGKIFKNNCNKHCSHSLIKVNEL